MTLPVAAAAGHVRGSPPPLPDAQAPPPVAATSGHEVARYRLEHYLDATGAWHHVGDADEHMEALRLYNRALDDLATPGPLRLLHPHGPVMARRGQAGRSPPALQA